MKLRKIPKAFVNLGDLPGVVLRIGYHHTWNFTGKSLPGYGSEAAWMHGIAFDPLHVALRTLRKTGRGVIVYDAYRPYRATKAMVAYCESTGHEDWLNGWVGRRSKHNRGVAIDLGLTVLETGEPLDMGGAWDAFESASHFDVASGEAAENRKRLRGAMVAAGFEPYEREWWHFHFPADPMPPVRDVPYGLEESAEEVLPIDP